MTRPAHLPDYTSPPLDEVVMGVQFSKNPKYNSVHAMKVWELFKSEFPVVVEQSLLDPSFETFGGTNIRPGRGIHIGGAPVGSRFWFLTDNEEHLVQFQPDRFLINWRDGPSSQAYPRFEGISEAFKNNLNKLSEYFASDFDFQMDINQAEISYINVIPVDDFSKAGEWFSLWSDNELNIEAMNANFSEVITDSSGAPFARLNHQIESVYSTDQKHKAFRLSLTYKGKPSDNSIDSAMDFIAGGRDAIVTRFSEITTKKAHQCWGRKK